MYLDLIDDPWTLHDHSVSLSDADPENVMAVDGRRDPRLVCGVTTVPWYKTHSKKLPSASFPFRNNGSVCSIFYLPTPNKERQDSDFISTIGINSESYSMMQKETVQRYIEDMPDDSKEAAVNAWINWSVRLFQEIADKHGVNDDDFAGISRRVWDVVYECVGSDETSDALMSLIVQLTQDHHLRNALRSISRTPRKVLERVRQNLKLSRIQQLDGACIREYARRPGYDTATKAGPKQELLALNRLENTNTLENRVTVWVLSAVENLARKYVRENNQFISSERVSSVRRFGNESKQLSLSPALGNITGADLVHPVQPNYSLQLDRRYKVIFDAYKRLLHDQQEKDDAWEWQRVLWSGVARIVVYSLLSMMYKPDYTNFVYIRNEGIQGRWLCEGCAPGPLVINKQRFFLIDAWDVINSDEWLTIPEVFPGAHDVGRIGCDAVLYSRNKLMLIWFTFGTESTAPFMQKRLNSCQDAIGRFIQDLRRQNKMLAKVCGLIVTSVFQKDAEVHLSRTADIGKPLTCMLQIPYHVFLHCKSLQQQLEQIIGEFIA